MKSLRNIKLRTYCPDARALVLRQAHNPLKHSVAIQPSFLLTSNFNAQFKVPIDFEIPASDPYAISAPHAPSDLNPGYCLIKMSEAMLLGLIPFHYTMCHTGHLPRSFLGRRAVSPP